MRDNNIYFDFSDDSYEDISSSSVPKTEEYEDIVSDSSLRRGRGGAHAKSKPKKKSFAVWWKALKKGQKAAIISLTSVILVISIVIGWFFSYFNYNYVNLTGDYDDLGITAVIDKKVVNIALFGIDTRNSESFKGNADSIMILSLNTNTKKVKIISVMRDTLVPIEKDGKTSYNKINSAYQRGGAQLAIKTLNQVFGLDISEYATVNFSGMSDIIDAVGGIDAELTKNEINRDYGLNSLIFEQCQILGLNAEDYYVKEAGKQHLNGVQAVAYSRIRYIANIWGTNNDYGRTDRQRYVMEQLFNKATQMSKTQYVKLAKALIPCSETSLSYSEIMSLAVNILLHSPSFEQTRVPQEDFIMTSPKGSFGSVVYYDLDYAADVIHAVIYDDMTVEEYVEANGIEKNNWYAKRGSSGSSGSSGNSGSSSKNSTVTSSAESSKVEVSSEDESDSGNTGGSNENIDNEDDTVTGGDTEGEDDATGGDTTGDDTGTVEDPDTDTDPDTEEDNTGGDSTGGDGTDGSDDTADGGDSDEAEDGDGAGTGDTTPPAGETPAQ